MVSGNLETSALKISEGIQSTRVGRETLQAKFKQVPEAQNFQLSKASSTAKAGEGKVK